jgi:Domain of unknown function (DUF4149)
MRLTLAVHLLALTVVVGFAVFFAFVAAPLSFKVLPTRDLAGALNAREISVLTIAMVIAFAVLFLTSVALTRRAASRWMRILLPRIALVGFFAALVSQMLVIPAMEEIRRKAHGLIDNLPNGGSLLVRFYRFHGISVALLLVEILIGLVLVAATPALLAPAEPKAQSDAEKLRKAEPDEHRPA